MGGSISMVDFGEVFLSAVCVELILVATCSLVIFFYKYFVLGVFLRHVRKVEIHQN